MMPQLVFLLSHDLAGNRPQALAQTNAPDSENITAATDESLTPLFQADKGLLMRFIKKTNIMMNRLYFLTFLLFLSLHAIAQEGTGNILSINPAAKDTVDSKGNKVFLLSDDCDNEAMRVIKAMPTWKPGRQDGSPVNVRVLMPVSYRLG